VAVRTGNCVHNRPLGYFGNGLTPLWWLTWIAPLSALVLAPRVNKLAAFVVAFSGWRGSKKSCVIRGSRILPRDKCSSNTLVSRGVEMFSRPSCAALMSTIFRRRRCMKANCCSFASSWRFIKNTRYRPASLRTRRDFPWCCGLDYSTNARSKRAERRRAVAEVVVSAPIGYIKGQRHSLG
jgi:hypothetical protein